VSFPLLPATVPDRPAQPMVWEEAKLWFYPSRGVFIRHRHESWVMTIDEEAGYGRYAPMPSAFPVLFPAMIAYPTCKRCWLVMGPLIGRDESRVRIFQLYACLSCSVTIQSWERPVWNGGPGFDAAGQPLDPGALIRAKKTLGKA
jgi:hypothetical protein